MRLTGITDYINSNAAAIIDNLEHESMEVHKFLVQEFKQTNVVENLPFQFFYRSFYRLDNAGLTSDFKTAYFYILEEERGNNKPDIKAVLEKLRPFRNKKNQENVQFSFATKLANTINNHFPIYDSEVASVFDYRRPTKQAFDEKVDEYLRQFEHIRNSYEQMIADNLLAPAIQQFDAKFTNHTLSDMKRLDFIFWSAGKLLKKAKVTAKKGKNAAQLKVASA